MKIDKNLLLRRVLPVIAGGLIGYAYYYYIGCYSGTCPIQSNPYISTLYGTGIGLVLAWPSKKKKVQAEDQNG
ncbi:MAG: DUF6132 family protein [Melioribacteraceae bacterium]|nr:DUF6132 family protein [Melioribacteraceae bacterium]MCF8353305.1 DUF6132 family protein [Melioribacteraceae bacterium]MCF8393169.1 DUF6132 family protein [Melioribacteraceae bacterium]MCF8419030.1 DUF6132 family protein [Melioribacteraceae bacterium]